MLELGGRLGVDRAVRVLQVVQDSKYSAPILWPAGAG